MTREEATRESVRIWCGYHSDRPVKELLDTIAAALLDAYADGLDSWNSPGRVEKLRAEAAALRGDCAKARTARAEIRLETK